MSSWADILDDLEDAINVVDGTGSYTYDLGHNLNFEMDTPAIEHEDDTAFPKVICIFKSLEMEQYSTQTMEMITQVNIIGYIRQDEAWTGDKTQRKLVLSLARDILSAVNIFFQRQKTVAGTECVELEGSIRQTLGKADRLAHVDTEFNLRFEELST